MNRGLAMLMRQREGIARTDEERMLLAAVSEVARSVVEPAARDVDQRSRFPDESMAAINKIGLNLVFMPPGYGPGPTSYGVYLECVRLLSEACASTGITWATNFHATSPIIESATLEQLDRFLPPVADGGLAALCITEPNVGSDASSMSLTIREDGDEMILDGTKTFITNGDRANILLVFGRAKGSESRGDLTAVAVQRPVEGLSVTRLEDKLGHRGSATAVLSFDACRVPRANVLGEIGGGTRILRQALNRSRPSIAAHALGIASAAIIDTVRYVNEREQFGSRIIDFQNTQFSLADIATDLVMTESWMHRVAAAIDAGESDLAVEASMLKLRASDLAMNAALAAVQLHGGYGYTKDFRVERLLRDAKVTQIWEGTNEIHRQFIGRRFADSPVRKEEGQGE